MSREIRFRAWDKNSETLVNIKTLDIEEDEGVCCVVDFDGINLDRSECELMQYTNQKNHENVEIYEGDYVSKELDNGFEYGAFEGVVELIDGKWVINNRINHYEELFTEIEQIEILGNIYENPELLERLK